jgi:hypothetical protein
MITPVQFVEVEERESFIAVADDHADPNQVVRAIDRFKSEMNDGTTVIQMTASEALRLSNRLSTGACRAAGVGGYRPEDILAAD